MLIKECEGLKREKIALNKEIEKHKENNGKLNARNRTLMKKLDSLKLKKINFDEKDDEVIEY